MDVRVRLCAAVITLLGTGSALAQPSPSVARLIEIEGVVYVNDRAVAAGSTPIDLVEDARIRTEAGRAIVSLKMGGHLALASHASVTVRTSAGYNFNKIEQSTGAAVVASAGSSPLVACGTDVRLSSGGIFRFEVLPPERVDGSARCALRVDEGGASTFGASLLYVLRSGQQMTLNRRAGDMIPVLPSSPTELDEFDRWSRQRFDAGRR